MHSRRELLVGLAAAAASPSILSAAPARIAYLFRGLAGVVFSRGEDVLEAELQARGVVTWIGSYLSWPGVVPMVRRDLAAGRLVALIGHSLGGSAAMQAAAALPRVDLVVTIDTVPATPAIPASVRREINFVSTLGGLGGGDPQPGAGFRGRHESHPLPIEHVAMAAAAVVHRGVVAAIAAM